MEARRARVTARVAATAVAGAAMLLALVWSAPPVSAAPQWLEPEELTDVSESLFTSDVAMGPDGSAVAVGNRAGSQVAFVIERRAGRPWRPSLNISNVNATPPEVTFDATGTAHVIFSEMVDTHYRVRAARRPPGGTWKITPPLSPAGSNGTGAQIAVDAAGTATAVWVRYDGMLNFVQTARRPRGGAWSPPANLSPAGGSAFEPDVAMNARGDAVAVWRQQDASDDGLIHARFRRAGGAWGATKTLSAPGESAGSPLVTIDREGNAAAVWVRSNGTHLIVQIARRRVDTGLWQERVDLSQSGQHASYARVAMDSLGRTIAAWARSDGTNTILQARIRPVDGPWGEAADVSTPGGNALDPDVAFDSANTAIAVWQRNIPGGNFLQTARLPVGGSWQGFSDITPSDTTLTAPRFDAGAQRSAVVVWRVQDPGAPRLVNFASGFDGAGPQTTVARPREPWSLRPPVVAWSALDVWSEVESFDVQVARSELATGLGAFTTWRAATAARSATFNAADQGETACFRARSTDSIANTGGFSPARCTAIPLDDRRLEASPGWTRAEPTGTYRGTITRTADAGLELVSPRVKVRRIALIATRAPGGGSVTVFLGNDKLKTVSLTATTTQRQAVIPVASFDTLREGRVRIVTTENEPVSIDGLGVSVR